MDSETQFKFFVLCLIFCAQYSYFVQKILEMAALIHKYLMKITLQYGFLKFYVMGPTGINLYGIAHVKVHIIAGQKMYIIPTFERFV